MFLTFLGENERVKWDQTPLSSQTPQTCFASPTYVKIYSRYYIFFGRNFSQTVSCFKHGFQIASFAKDQNIFCKCNYMANVFNYLPKSEAAVHTCSLNSCSELFHIIQRKTPLQESLFDTYVCGHFKLTILLF